MRSLPFPVQVDSRIVRKMVTEYPLISPYVKQVRLAYIRYVKAKAVLFVPIGLGTDAGRDFRKAFKSKSKRAGLDWIGGVRSRERLDFCPLCGGPGARTIDHHLPQSIFPEFAIFSRNLLPSCSSCNPKRGNKNGLGGITTCHPYFDAAILAKPMIATRIQPPFEAPAFSVRNIFHGDTPSRWRARHHIRTNIDLDAFRTWTSGAWTDIRSKIAIKHQNPSKFMTELREALGAEMKYGNGNSWSCSLLRGLLSTPKAMRWMLDNQLNVASFSDLELGI